jgi:putative phage-type endonuclease
VKRLGTARYLGQYAPGSPEWAELRRTRIGGSEIAAVLGLSPWESPFSLWHRKRGTIGPLIENDQMWWGTALEQPVAERFALEHPEYRVVRCGTYVHVERDYQLISPDRVLYPRGQRGAWELLEIKQAYNDDDWGEAGTDEIPIYYRCQVMWAMDALGRDSHHLAVYFGGGDYREYVIAYDENDAQILRKRAVEFLDSIARGDIPPLDAHAQTYSTVRELHPDIEESLDVLLDDELGAAYVAALAGEKAAKEEKALRTAQVADVLGGGRRAWWPDPAGECDEAGNPALRAVATRVPGRGDNPPYLKANPLPKKIKEIA